MTLPLPRYVIDQEMPVAVPIGFYWIVPTHFRQARMHHSERAAWS